jgi:hypothetical protein
MPVSENNKITVSDFNNIRNIVLSVMGSGSGSSGYGQTLFSSAKTANSVISQTDWDNLRYDIVNTKIHQTGAAFSATTNASNSANRSTIQFATSSVPFVILGMAVYTIGTGSPVLTRRYITSISTIGSNTILTLNGITDEIVSSGTLVNFGPGTAQDFNEGTSVSATLINAYDALADTTDDESSRFLVAAGQFLTIGANADNSPLVTSRDWSSSTSPQFWRDEISATLTVSFANSNQARWFFNSGGEIRVQSSRTDGRSDQQNNAWSALLNSAGVRAFGAVIPNTGFSPMNGRNFYRLTNTFQEFYRLTDSSPYTANRYVLEARSNVANNSTGTATSIEIRIRFIAGYTDPGPLGPPFTNDEIDGTFSITVTEKRADGSLIPSGRFTVTRPTYSITSITGT